MANGSELFKSLDETLSALLTEGNLKFEFRVPEKDYDGLDNAEGNIALHLYQTHENRELRTPAPLIEKSGDGFVRRRPPLRIDCVYMVTAWKRNPTVPTEREQEEHELLGQAMRWLSRFPNIPTRHLKGDLTRSTLPLPTTVAQMNGVPNLGEFWSALGKSPRAAFNLLVTVEMDLGLTRAEGFPVATKSFEDGVRATGDEGKPLQEFVGGTEEQIHWQIGGNVVAQVHPDAGEVNAGGYSIPGARVRLVKLGEPESEDDKFAITNEQGRFSFTVRQPGEYTLKLERAEHFKEPPAVTPVTVPTIDPADPTAPQANPYDVKDIELVDNKKDIVGNVLEVGSGIPMANVNVILDQTNFHTEPPAPTPVDITATTDANGDFTISGVNFAGRYKIRLEAPAIDNTSIEIVVPSDQYVFEVTRTNP